MAIDVIPTVRKSDISTIQLPCIVSMLSKTFFPIGRVSKLIHDRAGPSLIEDCSKQRRMLKENVSVGTAFITSGHDLPAKKVIHVIPPVYSSDPLYLLKECYRNVFALAKKEGITSLAIPPLSSGVRRVPLSHSVSDFCHVLITGDYSFLDSVEFIVENEPDKRLAEQIFKKYSLLSSNF
ncbi:MAG: macro domain-containing protein [Nanobdellota archaeon]